MEESLLLRGQDRRKTDIEMFVGDADDYGIPAGSSSPRLIGTQRPRPPEAAPRQYTSVILQDDEGIQWLAQTDGKSMIGAPTRLLTNGDDPDMDRYIDSSLAMDTPGPRAMFMRIVTDVFLVETIIWMSITMASFCGTSLLGTMLTTHPEWSPQGTLLTTWFILGFSCTFFGTYLGLLLLHTLPRRASGCGAGLHTRGPQKIVFWISVIGMSGFCLFVSLLLADPNLSIQFNVTNWATALCVLLYVVWKRTEVKPLLLAGFIVLVGGIAWAMALLQWGASRPNWKGSFIVLGLCTFVAFMRWIWVVVYATRDDYTINEYQEAHVDLYVKLASDALMKVCFCSAASSIR